MSLWFQLDLRTDVPTHLFCSYKHLSNPGVVIKFCKSTNLDIPVNWISRFYQLIFDNCKFHQYIMAVVYLDKHVSIIW